MDIVVSDFGDNTGGGGYCEGKLSTPRLFDIKQQ